MNRRVQKRRRRQRNEDLLVKAIVLGIFLVLIAIGLAVQLYAPCWLFTLQHAPVRCVVPR